MKWNDSRECSPVHGSKIFVWDRDDNKEIYIHFLGEWDYNNHFHLSHFPLWRYACEGFEAIPRAETIATEKSIPKECTKECALRHSFLGAK